MNRKLVMLRTLTWGTVLAALCSALLLATEGQSEQVLGIGAGLYAPAKH